MNSRLQDGLKAFERKQLLASGLALLFLVGLSVIYTYLYRTGQASESARLISRMVHIQDRREAIMTLQSARLDHFQVIRFLSREPGMSFTLPELADLLPDSSPLHSLTNQAITIPVEVPGQEEAELVFEFNRFAHLPWAVLIWILINVISIPQTRLMRKKIVAQYAKDLEIDRQASRAEIANLVRHNIRTPLSALMRLSDSIKFRSSQEAEIFQSVIEQIRTLISKLDTASSSLQTTVADGLFDTIQAAIQEIQLSLPKSAQLNINLDDSLPSVRASFVDSDMRSIVANLVTNSIEAARGLVEVTIRARDLGHSVIIEIEDNGPGIPENLLNRVMEKGFSIGKIGGTGLGLFHADECLRAWGGALRITSKNRGALVELQLPILGRAPWYIPRIKLESDSVVVIVDDQLSIRTLWRMKFDESGFTGKIHSFNDANELKSWLEGTLVKNMHFFMDYDLQDPKTTGFDLLKELPASVPRYLVTGHFDDSDIRQTCAQEGISLIPKTSLHSLPLVIVRAQNEGLLSTSHLSNR